ncbi:MAG: hypothetical protein Q4D78_07095 [Neisseria zoodegmatis]|uniref:hypothetical protein n=1 Tax=Neisseria zoodegmatis TaxID=326523 RepID=UPI0026EA76C8|nr:hypothetical protein [Neisseria zoodegmatis]MDO5069949.1 hypothetical protein [Neisseria zoodegmatis]
MENYLPENAKTGIVPSIRNIQVGSVDILGNTVVNVLAMHNEYVIYEIDSPNIQNRIKLFIDGHTDESEKIIRDRFNKVRCDYILAKGILSRSINFETNKQRIAHALAMCLNNDDADNVNLFPRLIDAIHDEQNLILKNRLLYLLPNIISICLCVLFKVASEVFPFGKDYAFLQNFLDILPFIFAILLGNSTGVLINSKNLSFQEFERRHCYFLIGLERLFLAFFTGSITYILIKSNLISSVILSEDNPWSLMLILIIAGYSESFIPSILTKSESAILTSAPYK